MKTTTKLERNAFLKRYWGREEKKRPERVKQVIAYLDKLGLGLK